MITIGLVDEDRVMESICLKRAIAFNSDLSAYLAFDDDKLIGVCIFSINGENGKILICDTLGKKLSYLEDGFIRTILSYMIKQKVHEAISDADIDEIILSNLGFTNIDGIWKVLLDGYSFKKC
jgi:hypothetical protein